MAEKEIEMVVRAGRAVILKFYGLHKRNFPIIFVV
jgi:hypothetical protein